jgi:hypothetical protein
MSAARISVLAALLFASAALSKPQPGLPFLLIWPTARSTALAGTMTGLADDPDAAFFNPAGLAFQSGIGATATYADWLPGLYPNQSHVYTTCTYGIPGKPSKQVGPAAIGLDVDYLALRDIAPGAWTGPPAWRLAVGAFAGMRLAKTLAVGLKTKFIHTQNVPDWVWKLMPELGIDGGGTGTTWAADVGALWKPSAKFSLGGSVANLGPGIAYTSSGERDPSPAILRLGACWTPVNDRRVHVNVLPEFDKVLVGMFFDSADTKTVGEELQTELRDVWKALAIEVTGYEVLSIRLGYFEDRTWQRGGLVFENRHGETYHYALYDLLTWRNLGKLESIGLCWGFGIGYKDYFRFDISSDAAICDFPTSNWKLSLVANDIAGGIRELKQGRRPWEE